MKNPSASVRGIPELENEKNIYKKLLMAVNTLIMFEIV